MREDDGRKLDHATLEALRIRAVKQIAAGAHPEGVAQALGMARGTVFGWVAKCRQGGLDALRAKPVPGRPAKLTGRQVRRIHTLVVGADPRQVSSPFALWTREVIRELICREFGVASSVADVGGCRHKLGLSVRRPLYKAYQQNPGAVEAFKSQVYPALRAQAEADGAAIYFAARPVSAVATMPAPAGHRWGGPRS